ncbi:CHAT domain-containing tetratricopeptide repeat protein [Shimia abyssi]|uniref:CHAT domain-containing protein n=1 Tax=Shimia abyssi TaxID=1662395 RepID=A0A2P8FCL7_9RHOB|nr:CHAT domain-containing protein [Shimia abyssi]PSL19457.1 CHAT domain-containing protein [Shimia abyssi]
MIRHAGLVLVFLGVALFGAAPFVRAQDAQHNPLALADESHRAAADAGDPYAAYSYVYPIFLNSRMSEATIRAVLPYLEIAYEGWRNGTDEEQVYAAYAARQIGQSLSNISDHADALNWLSRCIRIVLPNLTSPENEVQLALCYEDMAIALQALERHGDSLPYLGLARRLYRANIGKMPEMEFSVANTLLNEGVGLDGLKRFREAIGVYEDALELFEAVDHPRAAISAAYVANNVGVTYWKLKEYQSAEAWIKRALPVIEEMDGPLADTTGKARMNIGIVISEEGRYDEAIQWGMSAMPYIAANRVQSLGDQRWMFEMFSRAFAAKGQRERAIFFGKMAVNAQQELRARNASLSDSGTEALRAEWRRLYRDLADLLIEAGRISEAQAVLNMEKEEEVFEFLRRDGDAGLESTRAILTDEELSAEAKLAALAGIPIEAEQELRALYTKLDNGTATEAEEDQLFLLEDALQVATEQFDAAVEAFLVQVEDEAERAGLEQQFDAVGAYQDVLAGLDRSTAILQVAALDEAVHLFLTLPGVTLHEEVAVTKGTLARQVLEALQLIEEQSPEAEAALGLLHDQVFAPVRNALEDAQVEVVMLNLEGFLRYVPFAALHDGEGYLVERFAFSLYSPAVPTQFGRGARDADKAAGFGVTQAHPGFSPLPGVANEIETIFAASDGQGVLLGDAVLDEGFDTRSLRKVLARKPGILHIASHFALMPGQEDDSFLLLGDGSHLSLSEIREKRAFRFRGVDLLTLSACQTARGGDGSEIDGFGATAQLNGASAVMASLWPVADAATPILMQDFYRGMIDDGFDKAEALRRAQVAMLNGDATGTGATRAAEAMDEDFGDIGFAHPYFWSAFVLMGNWL